VLNSNHKTCIHFPDMERMSCFKRYVRAWDVKHDTDHCEKCQLHFCRWHCWRDHYLWIACTNYDHLRPRV